MLKFKAATWVVILTGLPVWVSAEGTLFPPAHGYGQTAGVYYPGHYYSKSYAQQFELTPGQEVLAYRLQPYQHYGRHRLGVPTPGLATGFVHSDRFPYRYRYGFVPISEPVELVPAECAPFNGPIIGTIQERN